MCVPCVFTVHVPFLDCCFGVLSLLSFFFLLLRLLYFLPHAPTRRQLTISNAGTQAIGS